MLRRSNERTGAPVKDEVIIDIIDVDIREDEISVLVVDTLVTAHMTYGRG